MHSRPLPASTHESDSGQNLYFACTHCRSGVGLAEAVYSCRLDLMYHFRRSSRPSSTGLYNKRSVHMCTWISRRVVLDPLAAAVK